MIPIDDQAESAVEEVYGAGWIRQDWLWACDDCLHAALDDNDEEGIGASCGNADTAHEARVALAAHREARHG